MALVTDDVRTDTRTEPQKALRTDLFRIWVGFGTLLALIFSIIAMMNANGGGGASSGTLSLTLSELKIEPAQLKADAGHIVLNVKNGGSIQHNVAIDELGISAPMIDPGASTTVDLGSVSDGTYKIYCQVPGHADAGMRATLVVGKGGPAQSTATMTAAAMDKAYMAGVKAFPAKTKGISKPMTPTMDGAVKVFDITAAETTWEVAPGQFKPAMAYNGVVPGPEIHVKLGDRVRIVLHNKLKESTSMHFHGLEVPNEVDGVPGLTEDPVEPGQTKPYEFTVPNAGTHIYHAHMDSQKQVPMGLFGAFIVDGPNDPPVAQDIPLVLNDGNLGFTINGKSFPATQPVVAKPGTTVRLRYLNEGLQGHPMHLHGLVQTVIAVDGHPVPQPYQLDTVWVAPGQRYDTLVTARPGLWAFHCHILTHAENAQGYMGMTTLFISK